MKRILTLIGSIFFALQFRLYADIAVYEPSVVTEEMVIEPIKIYLIPLILLIGLGIALIILLCCLLRYLRSKKRERDKAGSAEKTEKKKILDPMECIEIALLLLAAVVIVMVILFLIAVNTPLTKARIAPVQKPVFQGPCKICGYTNDDEIVSLRHECYFCKKCQETHSYTICGYDHIKAFWCYNCCMVGGKRGGSVRWHRTEIKHCCKCQQNHVGPCEDWKEVWSWSSVNLQWTCRGGRARPQD